MACLALLPVVGLETLLLRSRVGATPRQVLAANIFSALLGVPVALVCILILEAGFEVFIDKNYNTMPRVALMFLVVVFPCFLLSVILEGTYENLGNLARQTKSPEPKPGA